jgi:hypothetical protein
MAKVVHRLGRLKLAGGLTGLVPGLMQRFIITELSKPFQMLFPAWFLKRRKKLARVCYCYNRQGSIVGDARNRDNK